MSDKIQLLFEGHLSESVAPGAFRILEPFVIDGVKWSDENVASGTHLYVTKDNLAKCYSTIAEGDAYLRAHKLELGLCDCMCYQTCRGLGFI